MLLIAKRIPLHFTTDFTSYGIMFIIQTCTRQDSTAWYGGGVGADYSIYLFLIWQNCWEGTRAKEWVAMLCWSTYSAPVTVVVDPVYTNLQRICLIEHYILFNLHNTSVVPCFVLLLLSEWQIYFIQNVARACSYLPRQQSIRWWWATAWTST